MSKSNVISICRKRRIKIKIRKNKNCFFVFVVDMSLPSPPTFAQMMEDLRIMSSDDKFFDLDQLEAFSTDIEDVQSHRLINEFLSRLDVLQRLDASLSMEKNSGNEDMKRKLQDLIRQLQMCLKKLQTNKK